MINRDTKRGIRYLIFLVLIVIVSSVVFAEEYVVANSKDWKDVYLSSMYSAFNDREVVFFTDLIDSKLKTQGISQDSKIYIHESKNQPVVKNYKSYLKVNGYSNYEVLLYDDYSDLQEQLWEEYESESYLVLDPEYGVEALFLSAYAIQRDLAPVFLDENNKDQVFDIVRNSDSIFVGHFPVRTISGFEGEKYVGWFDKNMEDMSSKIGESYSSEWGVITSPARVVPSTIVKDDPLFVFYGDVGETAQFIKNSGIERFEVIGGNMADIAKDIEKETGKDLKLLLRYGKTITNVQQLKGQVMDLDTIEFPYPIPGLQIVDVFYYPGMNTLAMTLENTGNTRVMFYSNLETGGEAFSDENIHAVEPGSRITIPYSETDSDGRAVITTQYDYRLPLRHSIESGNGDPFVERNVGSLDFVDDSRIILTTQTYDDENGMIIIGLKNPNSHELRVFGEFVLDEDNVIASETETINAGSEGELIIPTPYLTWDDISDKNHTLILYYGKDYTIIKETHRVSLEKVENLITARLTEFGAASWIVVVLIVVGIGLFFLWKRRKNQKD